MGLDFSHCDAHWGYSSFNRFRARLGAFYGCLIFWDIKTIEGVQEALPKCPLLPLLAHSDCDGELTVEECLQIEPVLKSLVTFWDDDDRDKIEALELCAGMRLAIERKEPLRFF